MSDDDVDPGRMFVFAGAGLSMSAPAGLPGFNALRDALLGQIQLGQLAPRGGDTGTRAIVAGLAPELFMQALQDGHAEIVPWLIRVLGVGCPNAGHLAVAQLFQAGARVWTVNFDELIETAVEPRLNSIAAPNAPEEQRAVLKPHGTLGGRLVFTARDVLGDFPPAWVERLRRDVEMSDLVVFVGYRGLDLDLMPLWDDIIGERRVLWFDVPDEAERERKRTLLSRAARAGSLSFPEPSARTTGALNPTWDFVTWCSEHALTAIPSDLLDVLLAPRPAFRAPRLYGVRGFARAAVLAHVGRVRRAGISYASAGVFNPRHRHEAWSTSVRLVVDHGGSAVAACLAAAERAPSAFEGPVRRALGRGAGEPLADVLRRKRASILFNQGRHDMVLALTDDPDHRGTTLRTLRAGSMRYAGLLSASAREAAEALKSAKSERHPVRCANAALQHCYALIWMGDVDEAQRALDRELRPYAALAAARWIAWADLIEATLCVMEGETDRARLMVDRAIERFAAEGLVDGRATAFIMALVVLRQAGDDLARQRYRAALDWALHAPSLGRTFLSRKCRLRLESVWIEDAEYALWRRGDRATAERLFMRSVSSSCRMQQALAHLGLTAAGRDARTRRAHADQAIDLAESIGARQIAMAARERSALVWDPAAMQQVYLT